MNLADLRREYSLKELDELEVLRNPLEQFKIWFREIQEADPETEATAMTLGTASASGKPALRTVLLKEVDHGFVFFTNYQSRKGQHLTENPFASLLFFWDKLERQIHVEGKIEKISASESDTYFHSRPLGSRLGAWTSPQSQVIPNREFLETKLKETQIQYANQNPPRPEHWGGYRLLADQVEFWQGRPSRLHDRIRYSLENGVWKIERLAP